VVVIEVVDAMVTVVLVVDVVVVEVLVEDDTDVVVEVVVAVEVEVPPVMRETQVVLSTEIQLPHFAQLSLYTPAMSPVVQIPMPVLEIGA
jgi:hypothetical protein